jgi:hypothetical protein
MKPYARRMIAITSLVAVATGTAAVLNAQSLDVKVNVPFAFAAGTASLPRGEYRLSTLSGHTDAFMIRGFQHGAILLSQPAGSSRKDNTGSLVFHRYADQYFLREIRLPGNVGFELPMTAGENAVAKRLASAAKPEVVAVRMGQ